MTTLSQEPQKLEGREIPGTVVTLFRPTLLNGQGSNDPIARIAEVATKESSKYDHWFSLSVPDIIDRPEGSIELHNVEGEARLSITARDIFEENPGVLGASVDICLEELGIGSAIVESCSSNLSAETLRQAGATIIQVANESSGDQIIAFSRTHDVAAYDHPLAA